MGDLQQAEDAISQANLINNVNPAVWGMMTILCLTTGPDRLTQANLSFNEAIKLGLEKKEIFEEIGDLYAKLEQPD